MIVKKRFFAKHAKSSAAIISMGIHALLIVMALSFVAVTVITKEEQSFEAKAVNRPKMALKKLQVPVNIKKKRVQKPKLRKRIVVNPKLNQSMPDIKMPEISGVKGGLGGAAGDGLGGAGGIGFSMPEINIFGIKSKGEKVFLILDSDPEIMYDELGGIQAYEIIKSEMLRVISELGPTTLFNVSIYHHSNTYILFPSMVPANPANVAKAKTWLEPLNAARKGMKADEYGPKTLGEGGMAFKDDLRVGKFVESKWQGDWYRSTMLAMKNQADAIFLFTHSWGFQAFRLEDVTSEWYKTAAGKRYMECYEKGKKMFEEENKERLARGELPRVLDVGPGTINAIYFPGVEGPPRGESYRFTPEDYTEAMNLTREQHKPAEILTKSGLNKKKSKKIDYSFNVVHFIRADTGKPDEKLKKLTNMCKGEYRTIQGLDAIKRTVKSSPNE